MEALTLQRLIDETEALHQESEWSAIEALWRPHVDQGDLEAQFRLAYYYLFYGWDEDVPTRSRMEDLLRTAANGGHPDAVYWLSDLCPEGEERDALLRKAGELGSRDAQRDLGALYATGRWTGPKDSAQAVQWYRRAAERGHSEAQYNLGFMYLLGEGVQNDPEEGLRLLDLAAAQGDVAAMRLMADLYRKGFYGVPVDLLKADEWDRQCRVHEESQIERR